MPLKAVVQVGIDICRGLQDVHAAGMVVKRLTQVCTELHDVCSSNAAAQQTCPTKSCCISIVGVSAMLLLGPIITKPQALYMQRYSKYLLSLLVSVKCPH